MDKYVPDYAELKKENPKTQVPSATSLQVVKKPKSTEDVRVADQPNITDVSANKTDVSANNTLDQRISTPKPTAILGGRHIVLDMV